MVNAPAGDFAGVSSAVAVPPSASTAPRANAGGKIVRVISSSRPSDGEVFRLVPSTGIVMVPRHRMKPPRGRIASTRHRRVAWLMWASSAVCVGGGMRQLAAFLILVGVFVVLVGTRFRASDGDKLAAVARLA